MNLNSNEYIKYDKSLKPEEYKNKIFVAAGRKIFCYNGEIILMQEQCADEILKSFDKDFATRDEDMQKFAYRMCELEANIYNMMSGKDFLKSVQDHYFIDYDGSLCNIFVDGYMTNLGLAEEGICQGKFLITGDFFKELCESHDVMVNWANK